MGRRVPQVFRSIAGEPRCKSPGAFRGCGDRRRAAASPFIQSCHIWGSLLTALQLHITLVIPLHPFFWHLNKLPEQDFKGFYPVNDLKKQNWQQPSEMIFNLAATFVACLRNALWEGGLRLNTAIKTSLRSKHLHIYNKRHFVVPDNIFHSWTYWVSKLDWANAKQF